MELDIKEYFAPIDVTIFDKIEYGNATFPNPRIKHRNVQGIILFQFFQALIYVSLSLISSAQPFSKIVAHRLDTFDFRFVFAPEIQKLVLIFGHDFSPSKPIRLFDKIEQQVLILRVPPTNATSQTMLKLPYKIGIGHIDELGLVHFLFFGGPKFKWTEHNAQDRAFFRAFLMVFMMSPILTKVVLQSRPNLVLGTYHEFRAFDQDINATLLRCRLPFDLVRF